MWKGNDLPDWEGYTKLLSSETVGYFCLALASRQVKVRPLTFIHSDMTLDSLDWLGGTLHLVSDTFSLGLGLSPPLSLCLSQSHSLPFIGSLSLSFSVFLMLNHMYFSSFSLYRALDKAPYIFLLSSCPPLLCVTGSCSVWFGSSGVLSAVQAPSRFMWQVNFPVSTETCCHHGDLQALAHVSMIHHPLREQNTHYAHTQRTQSARQGIT